MEPWIPTFSLILATALLSGGGGAWLVWRWQHERYQRMTHELQTCQQERASLHTQLATTEAFYQQWQQQWQTQLEQQLKTLTLEQLQQTHEQLQRQHQHLETERQGQFKQQFSHLVAPLQTMLNEYDAKLQRLSQHTLERVSLLDAHVHQLAHAKEQLVGVLGSTKGVGHWGEVQLLRILEAAGLQEHLHYAYQTELPAVPQEPSTHKQRPDVILKLPEDRFIIIDAKAVYTSQRVGGMESPTPETTERTESTGQDSKALVASFRKAIKELAGKHYSQHRRNTPQFVILFVPQEHLLTEALKESPTLWEEAWQQQILLASPLTLLPSLRMVWSIWQHHHFERNMHEIHKLGSTIYEKLKLLVTRLEKVNKSTEELRRHVDDVFTTLQGKQGVLHYSEQLANHAGVEPIRAIS